MTTDFSFLKKTLTIITLAFFAFALAYSAYLGNATVMGTETAFYLLVSDSTHTQASAELVQLSGGAGYILSQNGKDCVAYSAYSKESDCVLAKDSVEEGSIVRLDCGQLYFKGKDKGKANAVYGTMQSLYGCISVLEQEIARLERGATQESSKRILSTLGKQFAYLSKNCEGVASEYAYACNNAYKTIETLCEDIVYASKLRHLHCSLCESYARICDAYAL